MFGPGFATILLKMSVGIGHKESGTTPLFLIELHTFGSEFPAVGDVPLITAVKRGDRLTFPLASMYPLLFKKLTAWRASWPCSMSQSICVARSLIAEKSLHAHVSVSSCPLAFAMICVFGAGSSGRQSHESFLGVFDIAVSPPNRKSLIFTSTALKPVNSPFGILFFYLSLAIIIIYERPPSSHRVIHILRDRPHPPLVGDSDRQLRDHRHNVWNNNVLYPLFAIEVMESPSDRTH